MNSGTIVAGGRKRPPRLRRTELTRAAEQLLFGLVPVLATVILAGYWFRIHSVALDFHIAYYPAITRLFHGISPYAVTHRQVAAGTGFVYPAFAAVVLAPFGLIGLGPAGVLYMLLCIACVPGILWALDVRDWRVYGVAMLWSPVAEGWQGGNVTLPLTLLVALAWRSRDRPFVTGAITAAAISIKPFVWPLALWLLATRRWKAAAWAVASGLVFNLLSWAIVGYDQIDRYLRLTAEDTAALWKDGYSALAVAHHLGLGRGAGEGLLLVASALAVAAVVHLGALRRRELEALIVAVALMLLASPLLWAHYFSLLLVPLALRRPRLGLVWALPLLMWPMPPRQPVYGWEEALAWGLTAVCIAVSLTSPARAAGGPRRWPIPHWRGAPQGDRGRLAALTKRR